MRNIRDNGGPVHPTLPNTRLVDGTVLYDSTGISLRDWFAGQALAGYFANPSTRHRNAEDCADYMYRMADAMISGRSK